MSDKDKCFPDDAEVKYRGAAPPASFEVIGTAKPHFIEIPFDDSFLNLPDAVYAGGRSLEEAVEDLKDAPDNGVKEDPTQ